MPEILQTAISPGTLSPYGVFSLRLILDGQPRYILLDDFILSTPTGHTPSLHSSNAKEAWPRLMEKALSKLSLRMMRIEGGWPIKTAPPVVNTFSVNVLQLLLGGKGSYLELGSLESAAKALQRLEEGFLMTCGSRAVKARNDREKTAEGVVGFHAYSVGVPTASRAPSHGLVGRAMGPCLA
jgi:hypothetical protein